MTKFESFQRQQSKMLLRDGPVVIDLTGDWHGARLCSERSKSTAGATLWSDLFSSIFLPMHAFQRLTIKMFKNALKILLK